MKRFVMFTLFLILAAGMVFSQEELSTQVDPDVDGPQEILVDGFESEGFWFSTMSSDEGLTTARLFRNRREGKEDNVLGARVDYLRRGHSTFAIRPTFPIPIEGETSEVSVWVAGRNFNHQLKLIFQDFWGRVYEVPFDRRLNFQGWQRLTAYIPINVDQMSVHSNAPMGIKILGFRVYCDPMEARGTYYIYFDEMTAITDLTRSVRDPEDMIDGW